MTTNTKPDTKEASEQVSEQSSDQGPEADVTPDPSNAPDIALAVVVVRGENGLIGIYSNRKLVATADKFSTNGDVERCIKAQCGEDTEVVERTGKFSTFADIPETIKD